MSALRPTRLHLDAAQVAAAWQLAGIVPSDRALVPSVGARDAAAPPARALLGADVVDDDGTLRPEAAAAVRVLADPARVVVARANRAGDARWSEARFAADAAGEPIVMHTIDGGRVDLAVLPRLADATVMVDGLLGFSAFPARGAGEPLTLSTVGFVALTAVTDVLRVGRLRAQLAREPESTRVADFDGSELELVLRRGLDTTDTRWAVTAAAATSGAAFRDAAGDLAAGIRELEARALLVRAADRYTVGAGAAAFVASASRLVVVGVLTLAIADADDRRAATLVGVYRSLDAIWLATWEAGAVTLHQVDAATALTLTQAMLDSRAPARAAA